jgi:hypothetical protein
MTNDDINLIGVCFIVVLFGSLFVGTVYGHSLGEKSGTYNTVKTCVETPQECKIMYDYYKLSESKK